MLISQLPTEPWYASIGDNTLADAILDRLMHNAHRLVLKGESMRKVLGRLTEDEHLKLIIRTLDALEKYVFTFGRNRCSASPECTVNWPLSHIQQSIT